MRNVIAFIALPILLASCQSAAQQQKADENYCNGIQARGANYGLCMMQRDAMNRQERQARLSRSAALMVAGAQIMAAPQPRPVTTTTCRRVGQQVVCSSF